MSLDDLRDRLKENMRIEVEEARKFLIEQHMPLLPYLVEPLPWYAKDFEEYVRKKARQDLPDCQFTGKFTGDLAELVEIGGEMGYSISTERLSEIRYIKPDVRNVTIEVNPEGEIVRSFAAGGPNFNFAIMNVSDSFIEWHTHPYPSEMNDRDLVKFLTSSQLIRNLHGHKFLYSVLYLPFTDQFFWIEI